MTQPLLRLLHARGERITVAAVPWVAPVYRAMPQVAAVLELPFARGAVQWSARRRWAQTLRGRFAVAYVCPNSWKSALIPYWAGIAQRVGYVGEMRWGLLNHCLPNPAPQQRPPMVAFYAALAGKGQAHASTPDNLLPVLQVPAFALSTWGLSARGYVVFAPGAEYGPAKRWPTRHFAALLRAITQPVVLLGSGKDAALCEEITHLAALPNGGARCLNLAGRTSLDEAFALIGGAQAVVSNDSGLMHVAAALGVPQVAVFGSSSPLHTPPLNRKAYVIWLKNEDTYQPPLDCAPCFARQCPLGHTRCLNDIAPSQVLSALLNITQY